MAFRNPHNKFNLVSVERVFSIFLRTKLIDVNFKVFQKMLSDIFEKCPANGDI